MEHTELASVVPLEAGWSDLGSWNSIWKNSAVDPDNNVMQGNVVLKFGCGAQQTGRSPGH